MKILAIETSCDETGASIIEDGTRIISNIVTSSLFIHAKTGGIIPENAAREQIKCIIPVIKEALVSEINAIAVTVGPGLISSLLVGVETAKTLAYVWRKPIVPVNHLVGHIYANYLNPQLSDVSKSVNQLTGQLKTDKLGTENRKQKTDNRILFPAIALVVSGGHTDLVLMEKHGSIRWLGGTRDDAVGEAFDKIGRLLGLPYPGGPAIEKVSEHGNPKAFNFPRPLIESEDFDFSFSGLKTAVLREVKTMKQPASPAGGLNNEVISDISASVQQTIVDVLVVKTLKAAQVFKVKSILLSGGVAANQKLRDSLQSSILDLKSSIKFFVPPKNLCTDNAAMIASAAFFNYRPVPWKKITANPELYFE